MQTELKQKIAEIQRMTASQMRQEYAEIFGEVSRSGNRQWLFRRIAWRLQSLQEGGLSERARKRALQLAREQDIRLRPPAGLRLDAAGVTADATFDAPDFIKNHRDPRLPLPGSVLTRVFKGCRYDVSVLTRGFEFNGKVYRSLSAVAHAITGSNWNGYYFFGLRRSRKDDK